MRGCSWCPRGQGAARPGPRAAQATVTKRSPVAECHGHVAHRRGTHVACLSRGHVPGEGARAGPAPLVGNGHLVPEECPPSRGPPWGLAKRSTPRPHRAGSQAPGLAWADARRRLPAGLHPEQTGSSWGQRGRRPQRPHAAPGQSGSRTHPRGCGTSLHARGPVHLPPQPPRGPAGAALTPPVGNGGAWPGGGGAGICARATCCRVRVPVAARRPRRVRAASTPGPVHPGPRPPHCPLPQEHRGPGRSFSGRRERQGGRPWTKGDNARVGG